MWIISLWFVVNGEKLVKEWRLSTGLSLRSFVCVTVYSSEYLYLSVVN